MNQLEDLGFHKNGRIINGFRPNYQKGNDLIFLIGAGFWCKKIVRISMAFRNSKYHVFGILTDKAPRVADKDWVTGYPDTILIKLDPLLKSQWNKEGSDLEYIPMDESELNGHLI